MSGTITFILSAILLFAYFATSDIELAVGAIILTIYSAEASIMASIEKGR